MSDEDWLKTPAAKRARERLSKEGICGTLIGRLACENCGEQMLLVNIPPGDQAQQAGGTNADR